MSRIRTIKPEFPQSESMGRVSRDARLLFVNLWPICDDHGTARGNSRMLASLLFPYDDDAPQLIEGWIQELEREGCIVRYDSAGSSYVHVVNWPKHQKIDRPGKPQHPLPGSLAIIREPSRTFDSGSGIRDQGPRTKEGGQAPATDVAAPNPTELHQPTKRFVKPTIEEVAEYCAERRNGIDPQEFIDSNDAKGWRVGKTHTPMKDWKAVIRTWEAMRKGGLFSSRERPRESFDDEESRVADAKRRTREATERNMAEEAAARNGTHG